MKIKIFLIPLIFLTGCASQPPVIIDGTITGKCPVPPTYTKPYLEINNIDSNSSNSDKVKALAISIKQLMDYSAELETYLNQYK